MPLQALDHVIRVDDHIREALDQVRVALHLLVQVAGDVREVDQGGVNIGRKGADVRIRMRNESARVCERYVGVGEVELIS